MPNLSLAVQRREAKGKKVPALRQQGKIPAVLYGHGLESSALAVDYSAFDKIYRQAGASTLIDLVLDQDQPVKALIQAVQFNPVRHEYFHVDFHQIMIFFFRPFACPHQHATK